MLFGVKVKRILGYNESSALQPVLLLRSELCVIMKYWLKKLKKENVPKTDI